MSYTQSIISVGLLILVTVLYEKFKGKIDQTDEMRTYEIVKHYLVNDSSLAKSKLPIIWIHIDYTQNARKWKSFYSRNSIDLNQPYIYLVIKSIIEKCGDNFNVCIIDDESFNNIIPDWGIDISRAAEPIKIKLRDLALARILKYYGGLIVPPSFLCSTNLVDIYTKGTQHGAAVVGTLLNTNISTDQTDYMVTHDFMGAQKNSTVIDEYISYLESVISTDFTTESIFEGRVDKWILNKVTEKQINVMSPEVLGCRDSDGQVVNLDRLMGNSYIDFHPSAVGVYIPLKGILSRTTHQWFAILSAKDALESDTIIGKLLLTSQGR